MTDKQKSTLKFLREQCSEFATWDREMTQFIVDSLSGVNLLLESRIRSGSNTVTNHDLRRLQEINMEVIKKVRGE